MWYGTNTESDEVTDSDTFCFALVLPRVVAHLTFVES